MSFEFKYNYPQIARDSGFKLRQFRDGPLDWRTVGSVEVERVLREQQFEHIDAILFYLSEAPLASLLESNVLDSGISKYFILSQLSIQYLIFCRKFLDETVKTLRESLIGAEADNINLKQVNQEHANEIQQLHKKIIQMEAISDIVFPCHMCTKNFVSNDALNVHLSKKHFKNTQVEFQGHENDRTLINTIKLELEIKQLKERLNLAEKDIRQTVESKRDLPKEVKKKSSSTQIHTLTNDKGTQSNLSEPKENDCLEYLEGLEEKNDNYYILSQLKEKISNLETFQEAQCIGNQQSILDISQKLSEITKSLESRSEQDIDNLTKLAKDAITSSLSSKQMMSTAPLADELQTILSNTVTEVLHLNSEKLNEILNKIKDIYEEKLPSLEIEIQKGSQLLKDSVITDVSSPFTDPQLSPKTEEPPPFEENSFITSHGKGTYSIDRYSSIHGSNATRSDDNSTDISVDILESEDDSVALKATHSSKPIVVKPDTGIQILSKQMVFYGINSKVRTISTSKASNIAENLEERRNVLKKTYPRFYVTRNKLKDLINRLASKNQNDRQHHSFVLPNSIDIKQNKAKPKTNYSQPIFSKDFEHKDEFKTRLEKVLNSPVKKPDTCLKEYSVPIPLPRKRVMFRNDDY